MIRQAGTSLDGCRVLVTRAEPQASGLIHLLEAAGAVVTHLPAIHFEPPPSWESLDRLIDTPGDWDWIVFTSTTGVEFFASRAHAKGCDPSSVCRAKVAAVGPTTAEALQSLGIEPDIVPRRFTGADIPRTMPDNHEGLHIAVVRALEGRDDLIDALRDRGGAIHLAVAYETRGLESLPDGIRRALVDGAIDVLTFTSPSTAENVLRHLTLMELKLVRTRSKFVSIGPTTTSALHALGVEDVKEATSANMESLVEAVIAATSAA